MIEITAIFEVERLRFENADGDTIIGTARIVNGNKAAEVIKRDPYQLMHFRGEYQ